MKLGGQEQVSHGELSSERVEERQHDLVDELRENRVA
jgi:hypothetical protein